MDGAVIFSPNAFGDRSFQPSVDRFDLRKDPKDVRLLATDGVTHVPTSEVRKICHIYVDGAAADKCKGDIAKLILLAYFSVDAVHRPIVDDLEGGENLAHSQIECSPDIRTEARFRKLKEALALIASQTGFVVEPS